MIELVPDQTAVQHSAVSSYWGTGIRYGVCRLCAPFGIDR